MQQCSAALVVLACLLPVAPAARLTATVSAQEALVEKQRADKLFSTARPLVDALVADVGRVQRSMKQMESFLQIEPATKKADAKAAAPPAKKAAFDVQDAVKQMDHMGVKQMPAMLGLLKGMYASWKDKISAANRNEEAEKKKFEAEESSLERKKAMFKGDKNATETYEGIERYWKKQRSLSHKQYHTSLKLMHAGMEKMKTMIGAMTGAIEGKKPSTKTLQAIGQIAPEVVFLQKQVKVLSIWAKGASSILRDSRNPHPGMKYF